MASDLDLILNTLSIASFTRVFLRKSLSKSLTNSKEGYVHKIPISKTPEETIVLQVLDASVACEEKRHIV